MNDTFDKILVLDFGSQVTQLIARRIRSLSVYSEIVPFSHPFDRIRAFGAKGIILSGSPSSVYDKNAPHISDEIFSLGVPVLGICYGMQLITQLLGGTVERSTKREYGNSVLRITADSPLFAGLEKKEKVWMSHSDKVVTLPAGFTAMAKTENSIAAMQHKNKSIFAVQFHPEVVHTVNGTAILKNFVKVCGCRPNWTMGSFIDNKIKEVREIAGKKKIILGLSGGVDSSVLAVLLHKAVGKQLKPIFIDNGLLRKNEAEQVRERFKQNFDIDLIFVDAGTRFLAGLKGVTHPEKKRKIIGRLFVEEFFKRAGKIDFLAQGTLYPDVIESVSTKGPSDKIKTHHNRVDEILDLQAEGKVIEPFSELFKDEVREIGRKLNVPAEIVNRQPFPGPGLAVRIIGEVNDERLHLLREADAIVVDEVKKGGYYDKIWQSFAVLLPIRTVGVMGDERTYSQVIALRMVESRDGMTADWVKMDHAVLERISNRIVNEVKGINRVVYDISSKPPSTIEWE
ncbi:MAG: glutamine-hydrolyzing GMP synthase [Spirochaetes bacterium]|nr:glutamine-hydrolyzing GMP synthase [Spirochaetota bacterium]